MKLAGLAVFLRDVLGRLNDKYAQDAPTVARPTKGSRGESQS